MSAKRRVVLEPIMLRWDKTVSASVFGLCGRVPL
jgi:hypothetical protein